MSRLLADWGLTAPPHTDQAGGTQCLDSLIQCLDDDDSRGSSEQYSEKAGEADNEVIENSFDEDWQEVCEFMTQRKRSELSLTQTKLAEEKDP